MAELSQGSSHKYCVTASGGPLSVTLAWYDYPGSPASGGAVLVNNLDLGGWLRPLGPGRGALGRADLGHLVVGRQPAGFSCRIS
jgi:hypothetical protein